jgi:polar amino acid transport system permease protein
MVDIIPSLIFIGKGLSITLKLLLGSISLGLTLGLLLSILRYSNRGVFIIDRYISFIRGTPLILQLSLIYFSLPALLSFKVGIISSGIIAFGLNSAAYMTEIFRAGIEAIPKGQFEAAQTLQIPPYALWRDIIIPQVLCRILPAITNETITLLKETALITTIGGMDIMRRSQIIAAEHFSYFVPLCLAALYYYVLVLFIEALGQYLEHKVRYAKN